MHAGLVRLRDRVKRLFFGASADGERAPWHVRHRVLIVAVMVCGVFVVMRGAGAQQLDIENRILGILGLIMGELIAFMGKLIILLVSVLISFASYNNFVHAQPVEIGWVLMRDVANMFFIVILLVSAFSTIVGYSEFHYTKVLPKLLLMAVLINFSKTLIGLLIDFSQVLMLTFVNAFRQAAAGNFISALKLSKATALDPNAADLKVSGSLIPAAILAVVMLGIAMTLLVIMIAFIVFRIIGLWLLLIMSPMAFFALALPSKLSKAMAAFTSGFWDRLGTLLIAGPVMAFFLWLALAVVQGSGEPFKDLYTETPEATSAASFVTQVGNASDIATFIVAVALMLAGVEFAVKTASSVSATLGKFAGAAAAGGGVAVLSARLASRVGRGAARVGAKGAGVAFEGVDRLADVRGRVGRAGLSLSAKAGGVGAATFAGMAAYKGKQIRAKQKELGEITASLDPATRIAFLRDRAGSAIFGKEARAAQLSLADDATTGLGLKSRTSAFMATAEKRADLTTDAEKKAWAEAMAHQQAAADIKAGKDAATALGDEAKLDKYKEALKKNPGLGVEWGDFAGIKNGSVEDPKKYLEGVSADAMKDSRAFLAHASALGIVDQETGEFVQNDGNKDTWEKLLKGDRGKFVQEHMRSLKTDDIKAQLNAMDGNKQYIEAADASRRFASKGGTGQVGSVYVNQAGAQTTVSQSFAVRNDSAIAEQKERLSQFSRQNVAENSAQSVAAKVAMAGAGATLAEAFKYNTAQGTFENAENRQAFESAIQGLNEGLKQGDAGKLEWVAQLDTSSLSSNAGAYNEARTAAINSIDLDALQSGHRAAMDAGNKAAQTKIRELVDIISKESDRVIGAAKNASVSKLDLIQVAASPDAPRSQEIIQKLQTAGIAEPVAVARSASKGVDIDASPQLRALRQGVATRASTAARRGVQEKAASLRERRQQNRVAKMEKRLGGDNTGNV